MWWCQFIDWLRFETLPSSLLNFRTAYFLLCGTNGLECRVAFPWGKVFDIFQRPGNLDPIGGCEMVTTQTSLIDHGMQVFFLWKVTVPVMNMHVNRRDLFFLKKVHFNLKFVFKVKFRKKAIFPTSNMSKGKNGLKKEVFI